MKVFINLACILLLGHLLDAKLIRSSGNAPDEEICWKELTKEDYDYVMSNRLDNPTPAVKNFMKCLLEIGGAMKKGAMDEAGLFKNFEKDNSKEAIKAVMDKCKDVTGNNAAEVAYNFFVCFQKADV